MAMSDLERDRSHLVTARTALLRRYDEGRDPDEIDVRVLEMLVAELEESVRIASTGVLVFNGIEYAGVAGVA